jgi:translation elongation factor EF-1alpha
VSPPPRLAAPAVAPVPLAGEERVGTVTHYFSQISVAIVRLESGSLRLGDTIHIAGHTSDFGQRIESLQLEHQPVSEVSVGQEFGLKVTAHARENDIVYKMVAPQR